MKQYRDARGYFLPSKDNKEFNRNVDLLIKKQRLFLDGMVKERDDLIVFIMEEAKIDPKWLEFSKMVADFFNNNIDGIKYIEYMIGASDSIVLVSKSEDHMNDLCELFIEETDKIIHILSDRLSVDCRTIAQGCSLHNIG